MNYIEIFKNGYSGYANYLWQEITNPNWHNYFYWLILVSLFFFFLEIFFPWRKKQPLLRKDFWLDAFYMFFNFFLFSLIIYNAASDVVVNFFNSLIINVVNFDLQASNPLRTAPLWLILIIGFFVRDFVQWWTHRLLHRSSFLWEFHKVHHSVEEMGFAAHLRYHWMETLVYRTIEYIPLALLGIGLYDFFIIHIFTLAIGHYNHSNITVSGKVTGGILGFLIGVVVATSGFDVHLLDNPPLWQQLLVVLTWVVFGSLVIGPVMKIIFNSPEMHIWHHSYELPEEKKFGINFGISLAIWDYLFNTAYVPKEGRDIRLGFPGISKFPNSFLDQIKYGFKKNKN
ncbi:MAG: sterol desaturase family protein [Bacteroidetes bacterium]|jgi:sterol desaturase/sphingolipid hydroxylase (fatty acid hydroxylase superfamily)|nr:sterol desaturase family protein [Bacteroidota bacterium]MDF1865344.1 sterol desaturase family protein [Saprospiraceae bacterium]